MRAVYHQLKISLVSNKNSQLTQFVHSLSPSLKLKDLASKEDFCVPYEADFYIKHLLSKRPGAECKPFNFKFDNINLEVEEKTAFDLKDVVLRQEGTIYLMKAAEVETFREDCYLEDICFLEKRLEKTENKAKVLKLIEALEKGEVLVPEDNVKLFCMQPSLIITEEEVKHTSVVLKDTFCLKGEDPAKTANLLGDKILETFGKILFYTTEKGTVTSDFIEKGDGILDACDKIHSNLRKSFIKGKVWTAPYDENNCVEVDDKYVMRHKDAVFIMYRSK